MYGKKSDRWFFDERKDKQAALRFFKMLLQSQEAIAFELLTDKLKSYVQ